jgi:UDP-N-acetylmuramate: L-alanyl-gamma-D-glutamyl-meso-diaminopimelate ligase
VNRSEKLREGERFDVGAVAAGLAAVGKKAAAFADNERLLERLMADTLPPGPRPRVVVFFSNGSFDGIMGRYVAAAKL